MSSNTATATEVPQAPAHGAQGGDEGEKLRGTDFTYKRKKITEAGGHLLWVTNANSGRMRSKDE